MADKKKYLNTGQITSALYGITSDCQNILPEQFELFCPIYYPIALLRVAVEEKSFENYESVPKSILRFFEAGVTDTEVIADSMGLSRNYVLSLSEMLRSYGHIDAGGNITPLGKQSLEQDQKIRNRLVTQKVHVDALNGTLLRMDERLVSGSITDAENGVSGIHYLPGISGMTFESLEQQLQNNYESFIRSRRGILNTNADLIRSAEFVSLEYAVSYLVKLRRFPEPLVFSKRCDYSGYDKKKKRFFYKPFSVNSVSVRDALGLADAVISREETKNCVSELYRMLLEKRETVEKKFPPGETALKVISHYYHFETASLESYVDAGKNPCFTLNRDSFSKCNSVFLTILHNLGKYNEQLVADTMLNGRIIRLTTNDDQVIRLAQAVSQLAEKDGWSKLSKRFKSYLEEAEETHPLDILEAFLSQ